MALSKKRTGEIATTILILNILEGLSDGETIEQMAPEEFDSLCREVFVEKEEEFRSELEEMGVKWEEFSEFIFVLYLKLSKVLKKRNRKNEYG